MEAADDYPPDLDPSEIDDAVLEVSEAQQAALDDACAEGARDEEGTLRQFETLFFASTLDREE